MSDDQQPVIIVASEREAGQRLDSLLASRLDGVSRMQVTRAIQKGAAVVDGAPAKASLRIVAGQNIQFTPPTPRVDGPVPEEIPLDLLFEDDHMVVVNKPPNMVVHPARGHWSGTLTSALAFHFDQLSTVGGPTRPGIVHRLDRDTSGVIAVAKTDQAHMALCGQFEQRTVEKVYLAIVRGCPDRDRDLIDQPIGNHPYQREKKAIRGGHSSSRPAQSFYEVVERFRGFALVEVRPRTGRTHQIRLHLAHIGHPVLCDRLYGGRAEVTAAELSRQTTGADEVVLDRHALHAHQLSLEYPTTAEPLSFTAPIPEDIERTLHCLRKK